jgi:excisionase family DNA binding protein
MLFAMTIKPRKSAPVPIYSEPNDANGPTAMPGPVRWAYRIDEVAELLGVSRSFIYLEIQAGRLRRIKLGGCTIILAEDLRRYLGTKTASADTELP